jgi:putative mRNA 3-end processing factor
VLSDETRVVCDADDPDGDVAVLSHAHGDHWPEGETSAVCSALTADLAATRREEPLHRVAHDRVDLLPAGHVAGSRAALVTDPDGTRYLYTGDCSTRSRFYLDGFEPPAADILVVEATYGEPGYEFPPTDKVVAAATDWLQDTDAPVLLFGYALGRAQKLQLLAADAGRTVHTTDAVHRVNEVIARHRDVEFGAERYGTETDLDAGDALVLPMTTARIDWVDRLAESAGAVTAGFSGWAVEDSFKFRGNYDVTFPLSDHCDFPELLALVNRVDPERVYTQHGAADALASELTSRGYDATALRENQTALGDF